jgi:CheY-like chemotaxis protein
MTHAALILVVEDNDVMREGICELLQTFDIGYTLTVLAAENGQAALTLMAEKKPDLIVSDIMMPQVNGYEFLERVRREPKWLQIPFVFLTAKGKKEDVLTGRLSGANRYITKPFETKVLLDLIKSQLDRAFQLREEQAQEMARLQHSILQLLNHEFRTPLTYVTAYYEMLADGLKRFDQVDQDFVDYLQGIRSGYLRLSRLVQAFIQVIELRTGEAATRFNTNARPIIQIGALLHEAVRTSQAQQPLYRVKVETAAAAPLPTILGDPDSLRLALIKVIENAIKFAYYNHEEQGLVHVTTGVHDQELHIIITDNGIGFPSQVQARLFELFYQHNRGYFEQQGAGLGLTIAQGIINLHGGRIEATGTPDAGSAFTIVLPVYQPADAAPAAAPDSSNGRLRARVLILEDEEDLRAGLQELLEQHHEKYEIAVTTAVNGQEGLEQLAQQQPDLIISDIIMPVMDGYEFLAHVRRNPDWVQIPIIFLTARGEPRDQQRGLASGVEEYIAKPYDVQELLGLVNKQLDLTFQTRSVRSQDFDAFKRSILAIIPTTLQDPLLSIAEHADRLAEALQEARTETTLKEALSGIYTGSKRLSTLIESFIALAEFKSDEVQAEFAFQADRIPNSSMLIKMAGHQCAMRVETAGGRLLVSVPASLPPIFGVDTRINQALQRLLDVGLHYYPAATHRTVTLWGAQVGKSVQIQIHFAYPLPAGEIDTIEQILAQDEGSVINLALHAPNLCVAMGHVTLHNGRLTFTHDADSFTFTIALPIAEEPDGDARA